MAVFKEENRNVFIDGEVVKIEINSAAYEKLIKAMVSSLYKNDLSFIRELVSNAIDAGGDKPVEFNLIEEQPLLNKETCIEIIDYGVGMSTEFVREHYTKLGYSTKEEDKDAIGAYGVGRLSVLKYSDQFTVETNHKGIKTIFVGSINEKAEYVLNIQSVTNTIDIGTKIVIPIAKKDKKNIIDFVEDNFRFKNKVVYNFEVNEGVVYYENEDFVLFVDKPVTNDILLGDLYYNIEHKLDSRIIPKFKIGELKPTQSREDIDLSYNRGVVEAKLELIISQIKELALTQIPKLVDSLLWKDLFQMLSKGFSNSWMPFEHRKNYVYKYGLKCNDIDFVYIKKRGEKHNNSFTSTDKIKDVLYGNHITKNQFEALSNIHKEGFAYIDISSNKVTPEMLLEIQEQAIYFDNRIYKTVRKSSDRTKQNTAIKILERNPNNYKFEFSIKDISDVSNYKVVYSEVYLENELIQLFRQMYNTSYKFCKLSKDVITQIKDNDNFIHFSEITSQDILNVRFATHVAEFIQTNEWIKQIFPNTYNNYKTFCDSLIVEYNYKLHKDLDVDCEKHHDYAKWKEFEDYILSYDLDCEMTRNANRGKLTTLLKTKLKYDNNSYN